MTQASKRFCKSSYDNQRPKRAHNLGFTACRATPSGAAKQYCRASRSGVVTLSREAVWRGKPGRVNVTRATTPGAASLTRQYGYHDSTVWPHRSGWRGKLRTPDSARSSGSCQVVRRQRIHTMCSPFRCTPFRPSLFRHCLCRAVLSLAVIPPSRGYPKHLAPP